MKNFSHDSHEVLFNPSAWLRCEPLRSASLATQGAWARVCSEMMRSRRRSLTRRVDDWARLWRTDDAMAFSLAWDMHNRGLARLERAGKVVTLTARRWPPTGFAFAEERGDER